jgi:glycosyltransferase involved in cell wall biosynthesis
MLGLVDRFVAPSRFLRRRFTDWGIPGPAMDHIPHGLPEEIQPLAGGGPRRRNRFGFFGNIAPHKGPLLVLEALKRIDPATDLTLLLHGALEFQSGAFFSAFDRALDYQGARARYRGPYARRDVARLMNEVDWVVVPSTWWEAAPRTILESFRLGRPVITADVGGMAEMVEHEVNGFLFRHGDAADLARIMQAAAADTGIWDRMAASLPAVPAMAAVTARHLALYGDLVEQPRSRTA